MPTTAEDLAHTDRGSVLAAAGCGKTRLIAEAVKAMPGARQLVLTHTHAGVRALRRMLREVGAADAQAMVSTIDSFALRWAAAYPATSGLSDLTPQDDEWLEVHPAAQRILVRPLTIDHLRREFDGLFVDEYQDCSLNQHHMIEVLAEALPTRVVGDPMQAIFDFRPDDPLVDFDDHVFPSFPRLDDLDEPHRWLASNPELGAWLADVRQAVGAGDPLDFESAPVNVWPADSVAVIANAKALAGEVGSIVAIRAHAPQAHAFAKKTGGLYQSMEEMECRDLLAMSKALDDAQGPERASVLYELVQKTVSGLGNSGTLGGRINDYRNGQLPSVPRGAYGPVVSVLNEFAASGSAAHGRRALSLLTAVSGKRPFRRELLSETDRMFAYAIAHPETSYSASAWNARDVTRRRGRALPRLTVGRTLLVKGLEFEHAVVMDFAEVAPKHLYVALTRAASSLSVVPPD